MSPHEKQVTSLTGMIFTPTKALLTLAAYACSNVLATPVNTEHVKTASNVAVDESGISATIFTQTALIRYKYECPVGGRDFRYIHIGVNFAGHDTTYTGMLNAEYAVVHRVEESAFQIYKATGLFKHNMCLARGGFRHCSYSISGELEATADYYKEGGKFNVPGRSGPYNSAPVVTEACTPFNGHAKDCATAGKPVQCRIVDIQFTKGGLQ